MNGGVVAIWDLLEGLHLGYIPEHVLAGVGSSTKLGIDQTA